MLRRSFLLAMTVLALQHAAPASAALGPDAAACRSGSGQPAVRVQIVGFKKRVGEVQLRLYDGPDQFMAKGQRLKRVKVMVTPTGPFEVCVPVPRPGRYALALHHDLEGDGGKGWNDGGAYSGNPRLSLTRLKPRFEQAAFVVGDQPAVIRVTMLYRKGLSVGPVSNPVN